MNRDIIEQRKSEVLIRESELRYRSLFENSFDGMMLTEPDGRILAANPAACKMLGMTEEEIKEAGRDGIVVRDDKLIDALRIRGLKGKVSAEITFKRKDGTTFIGETTSAVFRGKDGVLQTSMIIRDITERKKVEEELRKSEEKYRRFADSLPEVVFEADANGQLTFVNKTASTFFGYTQDELYKMNLFQFVVPEDLQKARKNFRSRFRGHSSFVEYTVIKKDGTRFPVTLFATASVRSDGTPSVQGFILDTAELRLAEKRLAVLNEKLRVVGGLIRHDVRNKLTVIRGRANLLEMKIGNNPELLKHLEEIDKAVDQCDKMFEFSRLYEKIGAEEPKQVDVGKCFTEAIALLPDLGAIKIVNNCQGLKVMADSMLRQLFYNLLENSLEHGKKVTQIRVYCAKDGEKTELVYEDNGVGIPKKSKERLFVEGFTTGTGLGLGLQLVKRMIQTYGWTIKEAGIPRKGAKFTITIPKQ